MKPEDLKRQLAEFKQSPQQRAFLLSRESEDGGIDEEARTAWVNFSSEEPYQRWFGNEILGHADGEIDLSRMEGGALLVNHNWDDQVGVIEQVRIDEDRRGRALVRFGKSQRASEIFQDVVDGIRRQISVGYMVHEMELTTERSDGPSDYRVTNWQPYEISSVAVAADPSVGVGRLDEKLAPKNPKPEVETEIKQVDEMKDKETPAVNVDHERAEAAKIERARVADLLETGARFGADDLARDYVKSGKSVDELNREILERSGHKVESVAGPAEIGLTAKEADSFSFARLLDAMANPNDKKAQERAAFELDCSAAASSASKRETRGAMVPFDVLTRDHSVGVAADGGDLVATDLMAGSFIEKLENALAMRECGATVLTGLTGNIAIPRQTGGASHFWLAENGAPSESSATFDQIALTPKTVGAFTEVSRKLLQQGSISVEAFVRNELALRLALAIDSAGINGSGTGNEPRGIMNVAGVGAGAVGGTDGGAPTWSHIVKMETDITSANAAMGSLKYLTNTKVRGKLKETEKFANSGREIWTGDANPLNGYGAVVSNQVPANLTKGTGTDLSAMIFGNFADLIIGMWGGLDLQVNPYSLDTTGAVRVTAFQDVDLAVRHPESFSVFKDIITQ